ncbi:MAG: tetratricopeptide repeat protein [Lentisphaerae bacterium]|jgi:tetratricopeptide (TPR) repeat protein|nr:tetratricopeptide repeat protein [Lentisphaerota bacterium]
METKQTPPNLPPESSGEMDELLSWLNEYGKPIFSGLIIGIVLVAGIYLWRQRQSEKAEAAVQALFEGGSPEEYLQRAIAEPKAPTAPLALASAAADFYAQGRYDEALSAYESLLEQYPESLPAPNARLGRAASLEALDDFAGAADAFEDAAGRVEGFLLLQATLGAGRCREQLGQLDEARAIYEDYLVAHPEGDWQAQIESSLLLLKRAERARALPPPAEATMLATEEVVVEEPAVEVEPVADEPAIEEPVAEEPAAEEVAVADEPAVEESVAEEAAAEDESDESPSDEDDAPTPED